MLKESEAWEYLYHKWKYYRKTRQSYVHIEANNGDSLGICHCIFDLCQTHNLHPTIQESMERKITNHPRYGFSMFLWPLTLQGAEERAKFCQEQMWKCRLKEAQDGYQARKVWFINGTPS